MPRPFRLAGIVAGLVLVAFGIGAIVIGISGRHEVSTDVKREQIVGTPDMKPSLIAVAVKEAGLQNVEIPTCDVAGKAITNGSEAKCFAGYMRIHALEATGGKTYAQMPQYATADGKGTNVPAEAAKDPKSGPAAEQPRSPGLDQRDRAEARHSTPRSLPRSVGLFAIVMGLALLLSGIGFIVLAAGLLGPEGLRRRREGVPPPDTPSRPRSEAAGGLVDRRVDGPRRYRSCRAPIIAMSARAISSWRGSSGARSARPTLIVCRRHRVLEPGLPAPVPRRRPQDRPVVDHRQPRGRHPDPHPRPARQEPRHRDPRRRHRGDQPAPSPTTRSLRQRPGLSLRPAAHPASRHRTARRGGAATRAGRRLAGVVGEDRCHHAAGRGVVGVSEQVPDLVDHR